MRVGQTFYKDFGRDCVQAVKRVRGMRVLTPNWGSAIPAGGNVVALRRVRGRAVARQFKEKQ